MPNPPSRPGAALPRRRTLSALIRRASLALALGVAGRSMTWADAATRAAEPPTEPPTEPPAALPAERALELADGVFLLPGANAPPDAANAGRVGNLGFVVGERSIAVIDSGSSRARAAELLIALRQVSTLPLSQVIITHPAQEFLFGAGLFADLGVPVLAHPRTPALMAQRCRHCLDTLQRELGAVRMAGTRLESPQPIALPPAPIDLGGRRLLLQAGPAGTVPGNLMVRDERSGVLFTGALLSVDRIPGVQDTRPPDWQAALAVLEAPEVTLAVPAYGPPAARQPAPGQRSLAAARQALWGYFAALEAQARRLYDAGTPLQDLAAAAELPAYRDWNGYPATHVHNIFYRYLQLEAEDLASP